MRVKVTAAWLLGCSEKRERVQRGKERKEKKKERREDRRRHGPEFGIVMNDRD